MSVGSGAGTTVSFTGFTYNVISIDSWNPSRGSIRTTHLGTIDGTHTKIPSSFVEPGQISMTVQYDPTINEFALLQAVASNLVIAFPDAATKTFPAHLVGVGPQIPLDDLMTASITFEVDGPVT